jgi:adenine deaminase
MIDLLIKNAKVYRTYRQCFEVMDIAITGAIFSKIAPVIDEEAKQTVDATGKYVVPGLIDCHMHIESSMTYPEMFSEKVLPYGVTTVVADPHEMANVFGVEGVLSYLDRDTKMDIFYAIPSSVPSAGEEFETNGASIYPKDVEKLLAHESFICLGEVMNLREIMSNGKTNTKEIIRLCRNHPRRLKIEGHCAKVSGEKLTAFILGGVDADHTHQSIGSMIEKIDGGMFIELQSKSLTTELISAIETHQLYESIALVTDDTMADQLLLGHLNQIVLKAIALGMPVEKAIYCATYTPARRMQLYDRGVIAPSKQADFVILEDLRTWRVDKVYKSGILVTHKKEEATTHKPFPKHFYETIQCKKANKEDFEIRVYPECRAVTANVIRINETGTFTQKVERTIPVKEGLIMWQEAGLNLITVFERYGKNGNIAHGFVENGCLETGAIATTWSHDSHNLVVLGSCTRSMVKAQHTVIDMQGGYCVVNKEEVRAKVPLTIGGIVSTLPIDALGQKVQTLRQEIEHLGYKNQNVIMSVSTLALLVSPELKISDKGLFNVNTQQFEKLIVKEWLGEEIIK